MDALGYLTKTYNLDLKGQLPIELPTMSRIDLAKLFTRLGFTKGVEVGTRTGVYTNMLCRTNPKLKLVGVDLHSTTPKNTLPSNCRLVKMSSLTAVRRVVNGSMDFVYLDTERDLASTLVDISEWVKKVRVGGIIAGHDYFRYHAKNNVYTRQGVIAYARTNHITPWFVTGRVTDRVRSWFWVKA